MSFDRNNRGDGRDRLYDRETDYFFARQFPATSGLGKFESSESVAQLAPDLVRVFAAVQGAVKDQANPRFGSKYADLASVVDACKDALTAHGFAFPQFPRWGNGELWLTTTLLHASGEWIASDYPCFALYGDPQKVGKVLTYARRYHLAAMCGVAPEDDDAEGAREREPGRARERDRRDDRRRDSHGPAAGPGPDRAAPAPARKFSDVFAAMKRKAEQDWHNEMKIEGVPPAHQAEWRTIDTDVNRGVNELMTRAIEHGKVTLAEVAKDDRPEKRDPAKCRAKADQLAAACPKFTARAVEVYFAAKVTEMRRALDLPDLAAEHAAMDAAQAKAVANGTRHDPAA